MSTNRRSPNRTENRDEQGRFTEGNPGGPGNPYAKQVGILRTALIEAVTTDDLKAIVNKLVELAQDGNVSAAKEVLQRALGRPMEADILERIERLEKALEIQSQSKWRNAV